MPTLTPKGKQAAKPSVKIKNYQEVVVQPAKRLAEELDRLDRKPA